ncbi:MAG: PCC domain-containing protein [Armatimonadota bacterium]
MQYFRGATAHEIVAVRLDAGEDLLESLSRVVSELRLTAGAVLSGTGTLEQIRLETPANLLWPPTVYAVERQGPGQIVSAQGHVANGEVELFLSVSKRGEVFGGKAMPGNRVLHSVELVLLRAGSTRWTHTAHPETGLPLLQAVSPTAAPEITLMGRPVDPNAIALVPLSLLRKHACLPVARSADTLVVAMTDPSNPFAIEELREATGLRIQTVAVSAQELMPALQRVLSGS